ncbi:hypothetical protein [Streptosporangium sandarakinum]|uniref:hypothetical protein n=1 Tax=Streptosporangium sandarakinum TaxID=1260955 RepID=UPI0034353097
MFSLIRSYTENRTVPIPGDVASIPDVLFSPTGAWGAIFVSPGDGVAEAAAGDTVVRIRAAMAAPMACGTMRFTNLSFVVDFLFLSPDVPSAKMGMGTRAPVWKYFIDEFTVPHFAISADRNSRPRGIYRDSDEGFNAANASEPF